MFFCAQALLDERTEKCRAKSEKIQGLKQQQEQTEMESKKQAELIQERQVRSLSCPPSCGASAGLFTQVVRLPL